MDSLHIDFWADALFPRFLAESDFKPTTRSTFRAALRAFAAWCRSHEVEVPDTAALNCWKAFLLARYQTATARTYLSAVKVFCRWLADAGLGKDIGAPVKGIKSERVFRKDCLSESEMQRILARLEDGIEAGGIRALRDFMMVLLIACCGLRVSEVSLMDAGDLDTVNGKPVVWVHGKGRDGKADFVPVPAQLRNLLFQYLGRRQRQPLSRNSPLFVSYGRNSYGKRLSSRSISQVVKRALVDAGFNSPRLTAHSLRHTAVTLALKGGATLQQVQQFARHRLIETTLRYAHNLELSNNPCSRLVMKLIGRLDYPAIPT